VVPGISVLPSWVAQRRCSRAFRFHLPVAIAACEARSCPHVTPRNSPDPSKAKFGCLNPPRHQTKAYCWCVTLVPNRTRVFAKLLALAWCSARVRLGRQPDPKRVAVEADVDAFLTGSLLRAGDRFRLTCQLIEAPSGSVLWSESANSSMQDLFMIQDDLCERVLRSLQLPLDERERRSSHRDVPASARAYEYYLRANQIALTRTLDSMSLARDLYLQCLEESPNYAPAWVRLGRVCHFLGKFGDDVDGNVERSEQAFNRAFASILTWPSRTTFTRRPSASRATRSRPC
jgi:hypothetical protein